MNHNYNYNITRKSIRNITTNGKKKQFNKNCEVFMHKQDDNDIELEDNINYILNPDNHRVIGDESSNAYALLIDGYKQDNVVIKIPRKNINNTPVDSLEYEYLVGIYLKNHIDKQCVNFQKVYGYINYKCTEEEININKHTSNKQKQVKTSKKENTAEKKIPEEYLAIERIKPGISFRQYFDPDNFITDEKLKRNPPPKKMNSLVKSLLLQVFCSLAYAESCCDYVHYDLHFGNVLIRSLLDNSVHTVINDTELIQTGYINYTFYTDMKTKEQLITYQVPIINHYVSTIIDYGRSHVAISSSIFDDNPNLFEPYKFLLKNNTDISKFRIKADIHKFSANIIKFIHDKDDKDIKIPEFDNMYDIIVWFDDNMKIDH